MGPERHSSHCRQGFSRPGPFCHCEGEHAGRPLILVGTASAPHEAALGAALPAVCGGELITSTASAPSVDDVRQAHADAASARVQLPGVAHVPKPDPCAFLREADLLQAPEEQRSRDEMRSRNSASEPAAPV
eukprot:6190644-Pleurochrysis_carterae.AAC.1